MAQQKQELGTPFTISLANLPNTAGALSSEIFDNSAATGLGVYGLEFELTGNFTTTPVAGAVVKVYFVPAFNGTRYIDSSPIAPAFVAATVVPYIASVIPVHGAAGARCSGGTGRRKVPAAKVKFWVTNETGNPLPGDAMLIGYPINDKNV